MDGSFHEVDKLKREIEALRTRLLTMGEVSRRITESLDLDTVLQEVVDCTCSKPVPDSGDGNPPGFCGGKLWKKPDSEINIAEQLFESQMFEGLEASAKVPTPLRSIV